ncbi:ABC transporter ATP-binding protein [Alicyclobacillus acidocaldarius]|uniref:ABC transporter related protein n=1 Tax=Alicyclobacillus acidocaldarius (strain Tc-4-1) TaxID=1048834 RepID=F8IER3_ALIAT|nr:ABC transporter ATP-binding protein [Alicyclobacillus acidocaldarius]AEJ43959.1 ABC transporter related protein [Alicyclobacillus acidocaldarius subsp. acidocaldarius Tc-4-1]
MIQIQHLDCHPILRDICAEFVPGEMVGLVGPNGAGKTTLLRAMAGVLRPTGGAVQVMGEPVHAREPSWRARRVAYLPQFLADDIPFTVREFVEMGRYSHAPRGVLGRADAAAVDDALAVMGLMGYQDTLLANLSGGERQRAAIARCLAQEAPILLLDEPIASLDIHYQLDILARLRALAGEGRLIIIALHHLEFALAHCHRTVCLHRGRLVADGSPDEVFTPELLRAVFRVDARPFRDPHTGAVRLSVSAAIPSTPE